MEEEFGKRLIDVCGLSQIVPCFALRCMRCQIMLGIGTRCIVELLLDVNSVRLRGNIHTGSGRLILPDHRPRFHQHNAQEKTKTD